MFARLIRCLTVLGVLLMLVAGLTAITMTLPSESLAHKLFSLFAVFFGFCVFPFALVFGLASVIAPGDPPGSPQLPPSPTTGPNTGPGSPPTVHDPRKRAA